jgi:hypothetical protein
MHFILSGSIEVILGMRQRIQSRKGSGRSYLRSLRSKVEVSAVGVRLTFTTTLRA